MPQQPLGLEPQQPDWRPTLTTGHSMSHGWNRCYAWVSESQPGALSTIPGMALVPVGPAHCAHRLFQDQLQISRRSAKLTANHTGKMLTGTPVFPGAPGHPTLSPKPRPRASWLRAGLPRHTWPPQQHRSWELAHAIPWSPLQLSLQPVPTLQEFQWAGAPGRPHLSS